MLLSDDSIYLLTITKEATILNHSIFAVANDIIASLRGHIASANGMRSMELHCTIAMRFTIKQTTSPCGITKIYCARIGRWGRLRRRNV